jgi:RNA polymerase sigma factor (sigma-70 family)
VLGRRIEAGDEEARQALIELHLGLVDAIARRYAWSGVPLSDLVQEGTVGLIQAVDRFDWRKGAPFGAYAALWIRQAICRSLPSLRYAVHIPADALRNAVRLGRVSEHLSQELQRPPTVQEMRDHLPPSALTIEELQQLPLHALPLDHPTSEPHEPAAGPAVADSLSDSERLDPEECLLVSEMTEQLREFLSSLGAREQEILVRRLGLFGEPEQTFAEIGADLGLSRQRVQQLAQRALARLRERMRSHGRPGNLWSVD